MGAGVVATSSETLPEEIAPVEDEPGDHWRLLDLRLTRRLLVGWTLTYATCAWLLEALSTRGGFGPASKSVVYALAWGPALVAAVSLTDRWPIRSPADGGRIALHAAVALAVPFLWGTAAYYACIAWVPGWRPWGVGRMYLNTAVSVLFGYAAVVAVCHLARHVRRDQLREVAHLRAAETAARAQLQVLTVQLQPHFLFNALNAVSSLLYTDRAAAAAAMRGVRKLLAHAGRTADLPEVPLADELDALRLYARVQELRFGDRLTVRWDVDPAVLGAAVPPFVLQPLLENAVKFSVEAAPGPHQVTIEARPHALAGKKPAIGAPFLCLQVHDDGIGLDVPARRRPRLPGRGLGVANVRDRLHALYGDAAALTLRSRTTGRGTTAELLVPLRATAGAPRVRAPAVDVG